MKLYLRLTPEVDDELRLRRRHKGDISRIVQAALASINLDTIRLLPESPERLLQVAPRVTASMDERIREVAARRRCTVSDLANSAVSRWLASNKGRAS